MKYTPLILSNNPFINSKPLRCIQNAEISLESRALPVCLLVINDQEDLSVARADSSFGGLVKGGSGGGGGLFDGVGKGGKEAGACRLAGGLTPLLRAGREHRGWALLRRIGPL